MKRIDYIAKSYKDILLHHQKYQNKYTYPQSMVFYRGVSNSSYKLVPSLKRKHTFSPKYNGMSESEIIRNALKAININESDSLFMYIAKLQHYGYPTRFLDFTLDFKIALYFACNKDFETEGAIYFCNYSYRSPDNTDTIIITELSQISKEISMSDYLNYLYDTHEKVRKKFQLPQDVGVSLRSFLHHGFMVFLDEKEYSSIEQTNPRIINQKGCFFVCGNKTKGPFSNSYIYGSSQNENLIILPEVADIPSSISCYKILIPSHLKLDILNELKKDGITHKYLFPHYINNEGDKNDKISKRF